MSSITINKYMIAFLSVYGSDIMIEVWNNEDHQTKLSRLRRKKIIPYAKSFAMSDRAIFWHPTRNAPFLPRDVFKSSHKEYWFSCQKCSHDFEMALCNVTNHQCWCSFCANKELCKDINCKFCLEKSFAMSDKAKFWHKTKNGSLTPRNISISSAKKCYFKCDKCPHDFEMRLNNVTNNRQWCSACKNKTEKKLLEWLKNKYPNMVKFQPWYAWCKNPDTNRCFPYDFEIFGSIIIELDGRQHIDTQISNWKSPEENQERDKYKMTQALHNGISVIRILQEDVFNDTYDWEEKLNSAILALKDNIKAKIICIGDCDIYREYMA